MNGIIGLKHMMLEIYDVTNNIIVVMFHKQTKFYNIINQLELLNV